MLDSETCEHLTIEAKPRISLGALLDLRLLIDARGITDSRPSF